MKYNFEALKDIDLVDLIQSMGYVLKRAGAHSYKMSCPKADGGDTNPSFTVDTAKNQFYCWHCAGEWKGDALDFVMGAENLTREAALLFLAQRYPFIVVPDDGQFSQDQSPAAKASRAVYSLVQLHKRDHEKYTRELLKNRAACESIMKSRGLSLETMGEFGLGIAPWGKWERLSIPNFDEKGRILSFTMRKLKKEDVRAPYLASNIYIRPLNTSPHYERVKEPEKYQGDDLITVYSKGSWLYHVYEAARSGEIIFIVEGHLDVLALWELGFKGGVALGTNVLYPAQASQLRAVLRKAEYTGPIVMVPDNDDPGRKTFISNYKTLREFFPDTVVGYLDVSELADPYIDTQDPKLSVEKIKDVGDVLKVKARGGVVKLHKIQILREVEHRLVNFVMSSMSNIEAKAQINELLRVATEPFGRAAMICSAAERLGIDSSVLARAVDGKEEVGA